MKKIYKEHIDCIGVLPYRYCFQFFLPRMLPGDPVAYLTGFAEEDMTPNQYRHYYNALHLGESLPVQFDTTFNPSSTGALATHSRRTAQCPFSSRQGSNSHCK